MELLDNKNNEFVNKDEGPLKSLSSTKSNDETIYILESPKDSPRKRNNINDFDILNILGRGSYAKVVLAKNIYTGDLYAIKIIDKKFLEKVFLTLI
jgi:serine/threonine protein kinase